MRVVLIRPPNPTSIDDFLDEPLGLLYLASALQNSGHSVEVVDLAGQSDWHIDEAEVYGIELFTPTAHIGIAIAHQLKEQYPYALLCAGGPHVCACAEDNDMKVFDYIIRGEGEESFPQLLQAYQNREYKEKILDTIPITDLDSIAQPARDMVDMMAYHRKVDGKRCFGMIGSRGCSHKCMFCDRSLFGSKIRFRSIDNIIYEIRNIIQQYGVTTYEFFDDLFPGTKKRAIEFYEKTKGMGLSFRCNARADSLDVEYYEIMRKSGCSMLYFGIESGNQKILNLMKKGTTVEKNYRVINAAHAAGLRVGGYFILGFPGETLESIQDSIDFVNNSGIDQAQFYMFIPLPGSEIYRDLGQYGGTLLTKDYSQYYHVAGTDGHGGSVISTPWLSPEQMQAEMQRVRKFLRERVTHGKTQDYYREKLKYHVE